MIKAYKIPSWFSPFFIYNEGLFPSAVYTQTCPYGEKLPNIYINSWLALGSWFYEDRVLFIWNESDIPPGFLTCMRAVNLLRSNLKLPLVRAHYRNKPQQDGGMLLVFFSTAVGRSTHVSCQTAPRPWAEKQWTTNAMPSARLNKESNSRI